MYKFTKREWDIMAKPIYPNMQFVSRGNGLQIQSMVKVDSDRESDYYCANVIFRGNINTMDDLKKFIKVYEDQSELIKTNFNLDTEDGYEMSLLYEITE